MVFKREKYLQRLLSRKGNGFVKIITGVRRCGKSYLLFKLFKKQLMKSGVTATQFIEEVERKVAGLRRMTKASVRTALIYAGELAKSVSAEGYFDFLIPAERLLELPNS